jgi:hypothetical protein
MMHGA